jgi:hypothetical protein
MIKLSPRHLQAVQQARTADDLTESVQNTIQLEFSTIPPYLSAMLSLRMDRNREIWEILHSVVVDEMLHMVINCNLLIALGGVPVIDDPSFVPIYPTALPMAIHSGLTVGCEAFSLALVEKMFMGIEQPENIQHFPAARSAAAYPTIGLYYQALKDKITELGDGAFQRDSSRQLVDPQWFSPGRLFPIVDVDSALRALDLIVVEGEGTSTSPEADAGAIAHYYRFEQILKGRKLIRDPSTAPGYSFSGSEVPFDSTAVWPMTANQKLRDLDADSQAGRRARQFAYTFTKLLRALHQTFNGQQQAFASAMSLMFELKLGGQMLCATPAAYAGRPTGLNAGPCFEYAAHNN